MQALSRIAPALLAGLCFSQNLAAQDANDESRFDPPHGGGAYLGLQIETEEQGIRIDRVVSGGAADRAGLLRGDLITTLGNWAFADGGLSLPDFLAAAPVGPTTTTLKRRGRDLEFEIEPDSILSATARVIADELQGHRLFKRAQRGDLASLADDLLAAVRGTKTRETAYRAMNDAIDRFDISHTAILTPWVVENLFGDGDHFHLGAFVQKVQVAGESRFFIRSMMHGSPVRRAGLRIGDELVAINGLPYVSSPRRTLAGFEGRHQMDAIQVDAMETVELRYRRHQDAAVKTVKVTADRALDAVSSARSSVSVITAPKKVSVGYIHFWNVMSADNLEVFEEALEGKLADAETLAIDLRGRGGTVAVIAALSQMIATEDRPVALLIDREARSAKEMLAHRLKGRENVTLIGETTAGAVLPANFIDLPGGARLMIPVAFGDATIRLFTRGQRLEGRGAIPDVAVDAPLPYRAGEDRILDRAVRLLRKQQAGDLLKI